MKSYKYELDPSGYSREILIFVNVVWSKPVFDPQNWLIVVFPVVCFIGAVVNTSLCAPPRDTFFEIWFHFLLVLFFCIALKFR